MPGFDDLSAAASRLRAYLQGRMGLSDADLDRGLPRQVWSPDADFDGVSDAAPALSPGRSDGTVSDAEVMQESFRRLEEIRFGTSPFADEIATTGDAAHDFYGHYAGAARYLPPWLIDDADAATPQDRELRTAIDRVVEAARSDALGAGFNPGTADYNGRMLNFLLRSIRHRRRDGGLGLLYSFDPGNTHRRREAVEAYADGIGDCNALSFVFYAMAQRAGLRPAFLRISGERTNATGPFEAIHHVGVAVRLDPAGDSLTPCDPSHGRRLDQDLHQWYEFTPQEMLANHLRNVALHNGGGDAARETLILQAYTLAPDAFDVAYDVAWFYEHVLHSRRLAAPYLRRAWELNPSLQPIWTESP